MARHTRWCHVCGAPGGFALPKTASPDNRRVSDEKKKQVSGDRAPELQRRRPSYNFFEPDADEEGRNMHG
jgi:hypothetical protein